MITEVLKIAGFTIVTIYYIQQEEEGWWEGTNVEGKTGMFPSNFVEMMKVTEEEPEVAGGGKVFCVAKGPNVI